MTVKPTPSHLFYQTRLRRPLLDRAEGIYLWDVEGNRYIDGSSGAIVSNIGHSNPKVLAAMRAQMDRSTFGYRLHFENDPAEKLAARIAELCPGDLERVFFVSGGSEAMESAIKLARAHKLAVGEGSRWKVISRSPAYHGCSLGVLGISSYDPLLEPFTPMLVEHPKIPAPTCYLDRDNLDHEQRGLRYAEMLRDAILAEGPDSVLAFAMEPVGGATTGALVAPDSYYSRVREICDEFGVLLIYDEVMSGAGRTGTFLAAEHWGVVPDIAAMAKGLGAGYVPLGAVVASPRIVEPVLDAGGFAHGFTYAGNPLACATGLAVLEEIVSQDMMANAAAMGELLKVGLGGLMERFPIIGDVRGLGLLLAFELVADRESMAPLPTDFDAHLRLVDIAYDRGLIIYSRRTRVGREGDHFLICPPMIVTEEQVGEILAILEDSLAVLTQELGASL